MRFTAILASLVTTMLLLILASPAFAAGTWFVSPAGNDGNDCLTPTSPCRTIAGALAKASPGDTVRIAVGTYTSSEPEVVNIENAIALAGGWNEAFTAQVGTSTIDGQGERSGIVIRGGPVFLERLVIENGIRRPERPSFAGGITAGGNVTLDFVTVRNNSGGGIWNGGFLAVNRSTVSGNSNNISPGAGGITNFFSASATITNSTISGNSSQGNAGGVSVGDGTVVLSNSTVTANAALGGSGGGLFVDFSGRFILQNTIVWGNTAAFFPADCMGGFSQPSESRGYNIYGSEFRCGFSSDKGDMNVDPVLGPLQNNGGPTDTHALLSGSPAIDAGNPAGCTDADGNPLTTDQRGFPRPQGAACDIGAFEVQLAPRPGTITIVKSTFATPTSTQFPFTLSGPSGTNPFNLDTSNATATPERRTFHQLAAGVYTAREAPVPPHWLLHRIACQDPDGGTSTDRANGTATIDLDSGETITCTFFNVKKSAP